MAGPRDSYDATEEVDVLGGDEDDFAPEIEGPDDEDDFETEEDDLEEGGEEELDASDEDDGEEIDDDAEEEGDEEEGDEDQLGPIDPPANWPQQEQQFFKELPPALQHAYLDRARHMMADYTRKTQEIAKVRQGYQEMERVISPHVQKWALNGMGPAQAMQQLIALSDYATNSPVEFLQYFANLRGIDLNQLTNRQEEEYVDPQVATLRQHLAGVQAQLNQTMQMQQQAQQLQQQQQYAQAFNVTNENIENFASQIGPDGKPAYPYFNELEEDMAIEIESGRASTIHEAYERAKWANPYTRSKLLAQSRARENRSQRMRAEEARMAASSLTGASGMYGEQSAEGMNLRQLLEASSSGLL
ncbi:MAG: hypothetical protein E6Q97_32020 [Desulfurellales bacterium]|nr:MAG: hypothetical protein E6Q97_32020 [Desulfurellales bacterium]